MIRCLNCLHENRPSAYFCDNCGRTLEKTCAHCGTVNRPAANFCDHCGRAFPHTSSPSTEPTRTAGGQIPTDLARKLQQARDSQAMLGERRVVTMLFCDVVGSTAAAEKLDPEEWTEIINGAFEHMIAPVYRYEGTLARLMGDAILAFFGAPIAHEDEPQRAVLAGLEIIREITPYWESVKDRWGIDVNVRVGINTGLVVVGAVGSDLKMEYTALGDAINLAARMEQTAEPGTVQVSENTYRLAAPLFEWEALGALPLKGKEAPVQAYRPLRRRSDPGRRRGIEGLHSPLVGRKRETETLMGRLADLEKGRGGIVFITGEAGLGKSRLVREVCRTWGAEESEKTRPPQWIEQRATSYDSMQAYSLLKGLLRRVSGLEETSTPDQVRARLLEWTAGLALPQEVREELYTLTGRLLAGRDQAGQEHPSENEGFRARLFSVMHEWLQQVYVRSPGVIFIDDLHWADSATLELFEQLGALSDQASLLFIFATRPEYDTPAWSFRTRLSAALPHRVTDITVPALTQEEGDTLLSSLLQNAALPDAFRSIIRTKSDGNPFFIEELVRGFIDSGLLRQVDGVWQVRKQLEEGTVPDNIEALLASRMDRLNPGAKQTLQLASVIGRSFNYPVLEQVSGLGDGLEPALEELLRSRMVEETTRLPVREYVFRQALTQETAYRSILRRQRKEFHRKVGSALETLYPDRLETFAARLAHHFEEAGETDRAVRYHQLAGDNAFSLYASMEAAGHFGRALEIAEEDGNIPNETIRYLFLRKGRSYELISHFDEALAVYEEMERWGIDHGDRSIELAAIVSQAVLRSTPTSLYDYDLGTPLIEKALRIAAETHDAAAEAKTYWAQLNLLRLVANNPESVKSGLRGLEIAEANDLEEQVAFISHDLGYAYADLGELDNAIQSFERAGRIWEKIGNLPLLADGLVGSVMIWMMRGDYERSLANTDRAYQISQQTHNIWGQSFSKMYLGTVFRELGRYQEALDAANSSIRDARIAGFAIPEPLCTMQKIFVYADLRQTDRVVELAEYLWDFASEHQVSDMRTLGLQARLTQLFQTNNLQAAREMYESGIKGDFRNEGLMFIFGGNEDVRLYIALEDYEEARRLCVHKIQVAQDLTIRAALPQLFLIHADILTRVGQPEKAEQTLQQGLEVARAINQRRTLWQILGKLSANEAASGEQSRAEQHRMEARDILVEIVSTIPEDLRGGFLARPDVDMILGADESPA